MENDEERGAEKKVLCVALEIELDFAQFLVFFVSALAPMSTGGMRNKKRRN
jgi:hypothetical protein